MADDRRRLPLDIAELLHDALCDCLDNGTGFTFRSADGHKAADALLPLLDRVAADAAAAAVSDAAQWLTGTGPQPTAPDVNSAGMSWDDHVDSPDKASDWFEQSLFDRAAELRAPARTDEEN